MHSIRPAEGYIWNPLLGEKSGMFHEIAQLSMEILAQPFETLSEEKIVRADYLQWYE